MKKIALFFAFFAGLFTTAMAQEETATPDSLFVVDAEGNLVGKHELAEGAYITFTHPVEWREILTDAKIYYYDYNSKTEEYTYNVLGTQDATKIYQDRDNNYFYVDNFLNSGSGFSFKIANADGTYPEKIADIKSVDGYIDPVADEGVYNGGSWGMFYANGSYSFTDTVNNNTFSSLYLYLGATNCPISSTSKCAYVSLYAMSSSYTGYATFCIDWR